ncbi:rhomboid family intramembrane serine protease [Fontisphaera persica]|uniref:rhomboid family intramembrane serine protease n=1 Tax=Fontisphaera persica TaxID=2974023 RepID=UPI0024BF466E|nr:rhomboid family intramembrane serine protease [Fontisphaera persica]WCJ58901.1 rhomboid family intramembrane serine protease [Fontisphaera persica]
MSSPARLPVRSEEQAREWSLVLISQGIETVLARDAETGEWFLEMAPEHFSHACQSLRLYLVENRNRRWQSPVEWAGEVYDWRAWFWALLMAVMFWLERVLPVDLSVTGRVDGAAVAQGEIWRLFTATTLHGDEGHLLMNLASGVLFLGLAMGAFGAGAALLASMLAGVAGNGVTLLVHGQAHLSLGASGVVMGALGLLAAQSLAEAASLPRRQWLTRGLGGVVLLTVLLGLNPASDVAAHLGGLGAGLLLGMALVAWRQHRPAAPARWDPWLAYVCGGLLATAWGLALWSHAP